ncbi:MAG: hypothetical protein ACM3ZE_10910, partial [Myxococcales bacterium]
DNAKDQNVAPCDWRSAYAQEESQPVGQQGDYLCVKARLDAEHRIDSAKQLKTIGFVAAGTGGAIAIAGLSFRDPGRLDPVYVGSSEPFTACTFGGRTASRLRATRQQPLGRESPARFRQTRAYRRDLVRGTSAFLVW